MKKTAIFLVLLLTLTACGIKAKSEVTSTYKVPANCQSNGVNEAFAKIIPPSAFIDTKWKPAAGTDLYEAINAGGIACSYGVQEEEIGGTVIWAPNKNGLWDARVKQWQSEGMIKVDIPGVNESAAYRLPDGATSADGLPAWRINLLIGDMWIQLGAAFIQNMDEASPIIQAAIKAAS
jgi:hypothetical protein